MSQQKRDFEVMVTRVRNDESDSKKITILEIRHRSGSVERVVPRFFDLIGFNWGDTVTCTHGSVRLCLTPRGNGYEGNNFDLYAVPRHQQRKEIVVNEATMQQLADEYHRAHPTRTGMKITREFDLKRYGGASAR